MSTISTKYSDWYNIHIKKYTGKNAPADASSLFDNSCLNDVLKTKDGNNKYLEGYRILSSESEELAAGETRIGIAVGAKPIVVLTPEVLAAECAAVVEQRDMWYADCGEVQPYIQSIDAVAPTDECVDDFVAGLEFGDTASVTF